MTITGKIVDESTGAAVPRATVSLLSGNVNLLSAAADDNGVFSLTTSQVPDSLLITSVGYKGTYWPLPQYQAAGVYDLAASADPLDTIIVEYKPKKSFAWIFLLIAAGILLTDKKFKYAHTR